MAKDDKKASKIKKEVSKKIEPEQTDKEIIKEATEPKTPEESHQATTKAGKNSPKAIKEAEELAKKRERKDSSKTEQPEVKNKPKAKPTRSRLERRGKKYREIAKLIEASKQYSLADALDLAVKTSPAKFDAAVELHINLNVDPRHADQNVRDTVILPAGTGKTIRVAVLAEVESVDAARKAGADLFGNDDIFAQLDKELFNFDVLIATPTIMPKLGKYAKTLGPKGLMPNPKSGTVSTDVAKAVKQAKAGRVEYRVDSTGIIHLAIGKVSFGDAKLVQNADAVFGNLRANKPASVKGTFIDSGYVTTTMGPSIKLDLGALS